MQLTLGSDRFSGKILARERLIPEKESLLQQGGGHSGLRRRFWSLATIIADDEVWGMSLLELNQAMCGSFHSVLEKSKGQAVQILQRSGILKVARTRFELWAWLGHPSVWADSIWILSLCNGGKCIRHARQL